MHPPTIALLSLLPSILAQTPPPSNLTYLTAPALVTTPQNLTTIQCWRLTTPFRTSTTPGTSGTQAVTIANITNLAYTILPPRYDGGLHTAPAPQIVHYLSGLAHITLPQDPTLSLYLVGGKGGLLFAADTTGLGHITRYPSDQATVALLAPFEGGEVPGYEVIREGPCEGVQTFV
ncbi:hypothetical protein EJ02DRAFT_411566 [Clathrospora elynae]|uniref:Uncharacterized protein n=1 Tax=Clathrospora elynae TaxID=706981 RepID=A0A6A5SD26_9PLEO|nr:hypothetical protein EJ02DRAFT_411566 [Clathrospora elynae]